MGQCGGASVGVSKAQGGRRERGRTIALRLVWYLAAPKHRPGWIRVDRLLGERGIRKETRIWERGARSQNSGGRSNEQSGKQE